MKNTKSPDARVIGFIMMTCFIIVSFIFYAYVFLRDMGVFSLKKIEEDTPKPTQDPIEVEQVPYIYEKGEIDINDNLYVTVI